MLALLFIAAFPNPNTGNGTSGAPASVVVTNFGNCKATTNASVDCLAGFNQAIASFGSAAANPQAGNIYVPQPSAAGAYYYLSGPLHITRSVHLIGAGGTGSNQYTVRPKLVWPAGSNGIVIDAPDGSTKDGAGAEIDHLSLTSSYSPEWLPSHSYTAGSIIIPRNRTGYVYVSGSGTHSSGSSEPTWNTTAGGTTSDGAVTWTTTVSSAVQMLALASVHDCSISTWSGNGIHIEAATPASNANQFKVRDNFIQSCAGSGVFTQGNDANAGTIEGNLIDSNDAYGIYENSFLGNSYFSNSISNDGISFVASGSVGGGLWSGTKSYPTSTRVLPTVRNGFVYVNLGSTASSGSTEPTWPLSIGGTVSDGGITWTCFSVYNGGSVFLGPNIGVNNSAAYGQYVEGGEYPVVLGEGTTWSSATNAAGYDATSSTSAYIQGGYQLSPVTVIKPGGDGDATHNTVLDVGDLHGGSNLEWLTFILTNKASSVLDQIFLKYESGFLVFSAQNADAYRSIMIPMTGNSGDSGPVRMPNGFQVGASSIYAESSSGQIHSVTDPTSAQDAATKNYVDSSATTGVRSFGAVGSSPSANGATVSGSVATLQPADGTHPGVIVASSTAQTLGGTYTFSNAPTMSGANISSASIPNSATTATSSSTASDIVARDSNSTASASQWISNFSTQAANGGTITLTAASAPIQLFTGSSSQTITLPDATTLPVNFQFDIISNTNNTITIHKHDGSTLVQILQGGIYGKYICTDNSTSNGVWNTYETSSRTSTNLNTATAGVQRDTSGNFSAGTITASLTGTASGNAPAALNSSHLFVGNASNVATDTAMSGDCSITNAGVTTCTASGNLTLASPSQHGILLSGSANATTALASAGTNNFLVGSSGADPAWKTPTQATALFNNVTQSLAGLVASAGQLLGTNTNDTASAGNVGEVMRISIARGSGPALSTGTGCNTTSTSSCPSTGGTQSITLTAGDWSCQAMNGFTPSGSTSITSLNLSISKTTHTLSSATTIADPTSGEAYMLYSTAAAVPPSDMVLSIPPYQVLVANGNTVTLYLVSQATFTISTLSTYGSMECRRMR